MKHDLFILYRFFKTHTFLFNSIWMTFFYTNYSFFIKKSTKTKTHRYGFYELKNHRFSTYYTKLNFFFNKLSKKIRPIIGIKYLNIVNWGTQSIINNYLIFFFIRHSFFFFNYSLYSTHFLIKQIRLLNSKTILNFNVKFL
jgi:hypothetical protein